MNSWQVPGPWSTPLPSGSSDHLCQPVLAGADEAMSRFPGRRMQPCQAVSVPVLVLAAGGSPGWGGLGASRLIRSPALRVMPGSGSRSCRLRSTETGVQPGGQVMVPSVWPTAGEPLLMVISRILYPGI
jgi:hypothetical protein